MKKLYFLLAAALLIGACSKVEVRNEVPDTKVTFQAANYVLQTKAGEVSYLNEFGVEAVPQFVAKAYMKGSGYEGYQAFFGANGETIYANGNEELTIASIDDNGNSVPSEEVTFWAPKRDYYWPKFADSYINFLFWYDNGKDDEGNVKKPDTPEIVAGENITEWTMEWKNREIGTGDNIIYADPAWHFKKNLTGDDLMYGLDDVTEGVPVLFRHALAQIEFRVYAASADPEDENKALSVEGEDKVKDNVATWTIKLLRPELKIYNKGTLSLIAEEPDLFDDPWNQKGTWKWNSTIATDDRPGPEWIPTEGVEPNNILESFEENGFPVKAVDAASSDAVLIANQSVLPQDLYVDEDNFVSLKFDLDILSAYDDNSNRERLHIEIPLAGPEAYPGFNTPGGEWKLNTRYIYTIKIIPSQNKVLFDPAVEKAWDTEKMEKEF